jgi:cobalt-zinc-cadmium efflux system membrane fusion protein
MKKSLYGLLLVIYVALVTFSCKSGIQHPQEHSHDAGDTHTDQETEANAVIPTLNYTLFNEELELFVEFPALVVEQISTFAAHFTLLDIYKPVSEGMLTVIIDKEGKEIRHSVDAPSSPGIFRPALQPEEAGTYTMVFELDYKGKKNRFEIQNIEVFPDIGTEIASIPEEGPSEEITFLKEQAWKTDSSTTEIDLQLFYSIIPTSGRVQSPPQAEISLNAQTDGKVTLFKVAGESVKNGEILATITGMGLEDDLNIRFNEIRISYEKSRADYLRTKSLSENQVISERDFLEIRSRYLQDSLRYYQYASNISEKGLKLIAPMNGFISGIMVGNGESVQTGEVILTVTQKDLLLIETYVNQSDLNLVDGIFDAHFKFPSYKTPKTLSDYKGTIRSKNAYVNNKSTRIPVTFAVQNNGELIPGMFLEAFLLTDKKDHAIVVPLSAIIEEHGQYYVFVQSGGESFIKKEVVISGHDGISAEINSGIQPGDRIVTRGAMQIKLAAMAGNLPLHGHTH